MQLSVIIPVFNAERTIQRTLESLRVIQSRDQTQIIVVNDGSTDRTQEIVQAFAAAEPAFHWRLIEQSNAGVSTARNAGLAAATGEWLYFLDGDDELRIDPLVPLASAGDATCLAFTVEYFRAGKITRAAPPPRITKENLRDLLTAHMPHPPPGLLVRRSMITAKYDQDIRFTEDWLFFSRNAACFDRYRIVPNARLTRIHIHETNASRQYTKWGIDRAIVAGRIRDALWPLTRKQSNNLVIQEKIGLLQQRKFVAPSIFFRWPCNLTLYLKLCAYAAAAVIGFRATRYPEASVSKTNPSRK